MTKFDCGCRIMSECNLNNVWNKPNWNYLLKTLRECLWEVLQETNEIPIYGKQTY